MCDAVVWQIVEAMHQEHLAGLLRQTGNGPLQSRNQRIGMFVEMGDGGRRDQQVPDRAREADRSEEHTSELQSLMRISYAVFCLKKKKTMTSVHDMSRCHSIERVQQFITGLQN